MLCACAAPTPMAATPTNQPIPLIPQTAATAAINATPTVEVSPTPQLSPTPDKTAPLEGAALVAALRRGGYVIYFRHAATDQSQTDTDASDLKNCRRQRNLTERGRAEALAIGQAFLALDIPIGQVLSSGYCRTRDTAMLAFGQAQISKDLTGFPADLREQRIAALRQMFSTPPEPAMNTVLVAHGFNITNTANVTLQEGEAAIFMPLGADGFALIARVRPADWVELQRLTVPDQTTPTPNTNLLLPDLHTLPPTAFVLRVNPVTGRKLLRFTNSIQNNGLGAMELWGYSDATLGKTIVVQHIYTVDEAVKNVVVGEFKFHPAHDHWHFGDFARYEIWSLTRGGTLDELRAVSDKVSYCLRDDSRSKLPYASTAQAYWGCQQKKQGISAGWIDTYKYYLEGQSFEVTDLDDGVYALRSTVNPDGQLWETNIANNVAVVYFEIRGEHVQMLKFVEALRKLYKGQE